jgi:enamine deaminase RidA (YjgF/YER057c/UK114 family)
MSLLEWAVQAALLGLLALAIPFAWRLERQITALRREGAALEDGAAGVARATEAAEAALGRLRATAEQAGRSVAERVAVAEPLRDDLRFLTERAEVLADRLDGLVRTARPPSAEATAAAPAAPAAALRSEAERELLRALRGGR